MATAESAGDLAGGYQLAYDALRKSAASLLAAQGLRPTSRVAIPRADVVCEFCGGCFRVRAVGVRAEFVVAVGKPAGDEAGG